MKTIDTRVRQSGIQALRATACALVILQHVIFFACDVKGLNYLAYLPIDLGTIGVSLFFLISGYVMGGCMDQGKLFLWNRAIRIYPPFWIAISLSCLIFMRPASGWYFDFYSALLIPTSNLNTSYRIPYWTLCYEIAFYCVTYALILVKANKQQVKAFCIAWLLAIVVFNFYNNDFEQWLFISQPGQWILLSPYSVYFIFGLIISMEGLQAFRNVTISQIAIIGIAAWVISTTIKFTNQTSGFIIAAFGYACALIAANRMTFPKYVSKLGDFSYGAYLVHIMMIVWLAETLRPYAEQIRLSTMGLVLLAAGGIGGLVYGWAEYRLHAHLFKGRRSRSNQAAPRPAR